jgi:tripartite-type tricarboxylate transporter receptor subunit TctC
MVEAGVPDFVSVSFTGIVAPAGTPSVAIEKLNAAIVESMKSPEVQSALDKLGVDSRVGAPEEFASFLARERDKWGSLIRAANIKPE